MSKSARIVARSVLNKHFIYIKLGFLRFRVYQPFIRDLVRAFTGDVSALAIDQIPFLSIKNLSKLLYKNVFAQHAFQWYVQRYATYDQIKTAVLDIADIVTGKDLFEAVKIDKTKRKSISETIGNNTITGMISSIMEQLNITYRDAYANINYPTLLLMMIDKCRTLTGGEEKIVKGSGKNMAERRKKRNQ